MQLKIQKRENLMYIAIILYAVVLFDFNLGNAVMPAFLGDTAFGTQMFGYLTSFMFLGQFIVAPVWGRVSDYYGRGIIFLGPIGYGIGQIVFAFSGHSLFLLYVTRIWSGIFSILFLSQFVAYISDVAPPKQRKRALSITAIMGPLGAGIAFLVGGLLNFIDLSWVEHIFFFPISILELMKKHYFLPFFLQFIFGIFLSFFLFSFLRTNNQYQSFAIKQKKSIREKFRTMNQKYGHTIVVPIIFITFFNSFAYAAIQSIPYFLKDNLGFDSFGVGIIVFCYNILSVFLSFMIQPWMLSRFNDWKNLLISNIAVVIFALILGFTNEYSLIIIMSIVIVLNTLLLSINQALLAHVDANERGMLLGANQSAQSMGAIIGSFLASPLYALYPSMTKHRLPFFMMAFLLLFVSFIILGPLKKKLLKK